MQLANQLRSLLDTFWPGAAAIFADVDSPIALDFLERFPAPRDAAKLDEKRLQRFLATHRYSGRRTPTELPERLRAAPLGLAGEVEEEAKRGQVLALVAVIRREARTRQRGRSMARHRTMRPHPDRPRHPRWG